MKSIERFLNPYLKTHPQECGEILSQFISQIKTSFEFEIRKLVKEKREYYSGEADAKTYAAKPFGSHIKTTEKMRVYLESDDEIINLEAKIKYLEQMMYFLDQVMKQISNRGFQIKNAIDWEKFVNGQ